MEATGVTAVRIEKRKTQDLLIKASKRFIKKVFLSR